LLSSRKLFIPARFIRLLLRRRNPRIRTTCTVRKTVAQRSNLTLHAAVQVIVLPLHSAQFPPIRIHLLQRSLLRATAFLAHSGAAFPLAPIYFFPSR
jgi:hypothetical protein